MLPSTTTLTAKQQDRLDRMCPAGHNAAIGTVVRGVQTDIADLLGSAYGPGLTLYVDGKYGSDDVTVAAPNRYPASAVNHGTTWATAFKTIQAALTVARGAGTGSNPALDSNYDQDHHVTVVVAPGNYAENLIMVGAGIRLVGIGVPGTDRGVSVTPPDMSGSYPGSMIVQGSGLEIGNILLVNNFAYPTMWFDKMHSSWVHDVVFYGDGDATKAFTTNGMKNSILEHCRISEFSAAGIEVNYDASSPDYLIGSQIRHNRIGQGSGTGILVDVNLVAYDSSIYDNTVIGALTLGIDNNATGPIAIHDNFACIVDNTAPIESASTIGGMHRNAVVYNANGTRTFPFPANA